MEPAAWGPVDGAIITPSFAYGFATSIHGNLYHLEGQKLLYSAGQFFAIMGPEDGKARFLPTRSTVKAVKGLRVANNKKYLAAVEETYDADQHQVSVYNIPAEKRMRTLTLKRQHTQASTVVGISFSGDAKLLLMAAGEPDYTIFLWRWHANKLLMTLSPECQVCCAALNPWDETCLALASTRLVRSYKLDLLGTTAKPNNHLQLDCNGENMVTCLVHLVGGLLAVGTNSGKIMVFSDVGTVSTLDINHAEPSSGQAAQQPEANIDAPQAPLRTNIPSLVGSNRQGMSFMSVSGQAAGQALRLTARSAVQALVQRGRGFVAAGSNCDICLFEPPAATAKRNGAVETYTLSRRLTFASLMAKPCGTIAPSVSGSGSSHSGLASSSSGPAASLRILGLSVSVTDDHLAVATANGKLLLLGLTAALQAQQDIDDEAQMTTNFGVGSCTGDAVLQLASGSAVALPRFLSGAGHSSGTSDDILALTESEQDEAEPNPAGWQVLCAGFPSARVVGLDACQHLPLLLVISEDKWVRVWDWVRHTRVAARYIASEQPLCCAMHPSGFMAALGTVEGLRLYYIMRRELTPIADLPIAKCSVVRYSHGGSVLAAVGRSNAIVVYPAYYGGGAGASGVNPSQWQGNTGSSYYTEHSHSGARREASKGSALGSEGACLMRPLWVLKAHVSTVTDLVFSGDDTRLVSSGAGGAVYFWDLATGSRLMELEYVDKKCVYFAACYHDRTASAVVRTIDGRLQHLQDGSMAFEVAGLGNDASPMALTGDGRVLLAGTSRGSVISIPWPKDPEAAGQQQQQQQQVQEAGHDGGDKTPGLVTQGCLSNGPGSLPSPPGSHASVHAGVTKHLSVQVENGGFMSPRSSAMTPGSAYGKNPSTVSLVDTPQNFKPPGSHSAARSSAVSSPCHAGSCQQQALPGANQQDALLQEAGGSAIGSAQCHQGFREYRLHAARVTAIKVLHTSGVMFTASADGLVLMSSLALVLDGILTDPPAVALPPSATVSSAAASAAAQLAMAINPSPTAVGVAAGIGAVVLPGAAPGLPLPVALVDDGLVLALKERIRSMAMQVVGIRKDAQYQVLRQTQALRESLGSSDSQAAALQQEVTALHKTLADNQAAADAAQQQAVKELEALHVAAAEQLEGLYEARLALEAERLAQMTAAKDDLELSLKEEMKRRSAASEQLLIEVHAMYRQQLAEESAKAESAAATAAGDAAMWQQVLLQTEEELEQQAEKDGEKLAIAQHQAGETEMKLKAEVHIINRTNARLKADKAADASKINELTKQVDIQNVKLVEAAAGADKLRNELAERDSVIAENYQTLQGFRRRVQELETHKFVLTHQADAAAAELLPKEEQITAMQQTLNAQDRELISGHSALLAAQRAVLEKNAAVSSVKQELWEARHTISHQSGLLEAVAHDIFHVLQQPDERMAGGRTARQQALEALAVKYCTNRGGGPRSSVQVEQEMGAHIAAAERKNKLLEGQLKQAIDSKKHSIRHVMADNTALLADLAEVSRTNKELHRQLAAATNHLAHFGLRLSGTNITSLTGSDDGQDGGAAAVDKHSSSGLATCDKTEVCTRKTNSRPGTAEGGRKADAAASTASGNSKYIPLAPETFGHIQSGHIGSCQGGKLLPGTTGRVLKTALQQQQLELEELKAMLAATTHVIGNQATQIQRLQDSARASQQPQHAAGEAGQNLLGGKQDATEVALAAINRKAVALGAGSHARSGIEFARGTADMYDLGDVAQGSGAASATAEALDAGKLAGSTSYSFSRPATAEPGARCKSRGNCAFSSGSSCPITSRPRSASTGRCTHSTASPGAKASDVQASTRTKQPTAAVGRNEGWVAFGHALHNGRNSPMLNPAKWRPSTAGGVGMLACLRSDLEAWRGK